MNHCTELRLFVNVVCSSITCSINVNCCAELRLYVNDSTYHITCSINESWNESVFSPRIISKLVCSRNNEASLDLRMMFRFFLISVFESLQSTMGIFLIYDIEVQIVYLTSGKTKSNSLNGGPLGSVSFFSWEFASFHWEF